MHRISLFVEQLCTDSIPYFAKYVIFLSFKMCHDLFIMNDNAVCLFYSYFSLLFSIRLHFKEFLCGV